jgi:hypothetical protein
MKDFVVQQDSTHASLGTQQRAVPQSGPAKSPAAPAPSHDDIARRAHDIYVKKGRQPGQCKQNWQQAEQELQRQGKPTCTAHESCCDPSPAPHAGCTPVVKTVAGVSAPIVGGKGSTRAATTPVPTEGRDTQAQRLPRLAT